MSKLIPVILLCIACMTSACGVSTSGQTETLPSSSAPATASSATFVPETSLDSPASPTTEPVATLEQTVSPPPGLHLVYLHEGDLWSWTETTGSVLLIDTGDLSAIQLSDDGQLLAFISGRDVWTVHMDGTDARLLIMQKEAGGSLWFAPNGSLLAVSTADHIDLIDLVNETSATILTYPAIPGGFYPEIVWSADSSGFKTVIPPDSENGKAEFLFVFPDGTTANLGIFSMAAPDDNPPFISPDGGYILYTENVSNGKESLFLMDSSGAAKPYGEPAENIRAYGWMPDSKGFIYAKETEEQLLLGNVTGTPAMALLAGKYETMRWLNAEHFLAIQDGDLYLEDISGGKELIADGVTDFDFEKQ